MENGEVEGQTQLGGVARRQIACTGILVSLERLCLGFFEHGSLGVLRDVAIVVTDHLGEEGFGFALARLAQHLGIDDADDPLAVVDQLVFNLVLVAVQRTTVL